jgi:O-antigen ligase
MALVFAYLVFLYGSNAARRAAGLAIGAVALLAIPLFLPALTRNRLGTVFGENNPEAEESSDSRTYLFQQSIRYTLLHPLFGVGPDQFSNFEGSESRIKGLN